MGASIRVSLFILTFVFICFGATSAFAQNNECKYGTGADGNRQCLVCNCYFETIGESFEGKLAVAKVVLARLKSPKFPLHANVEHSICGMVYEPSQFSWTIGYRSKSRYMKLPNDKFQQCQEAVDAAVRYPPRAGPIWYHADYVDPSWAKNLRSPSWASKNGMVISRKTIGHHIFYSNAREPLYSWPSNFEQTLDPGGGSWYDSVKSVFGVSQ